MFTLSAAEWTDRLQQCYAVIHQQRMMDIPILNDKIMVQAVGVQPWQQGWLGVLITPWCMNLVLLPESPRDWEHLQELQQVKHPFPSGTYEFTVAHEPDIGKFQQCSLFSPMFEFTDQQTAVTVAKTVLLELMKEENREDIKSVDMAEMERPWRDENAIEEAGLDTASEAKHVERRPQLSRRELIRGRLYAEEQSDAN